MRGRPDVFGVLIKDLLCSLDDGGGVLVSNLWVASEVGCSERHVQRVVSRLVDEGVLVREPCVGRVLRVVGGR